jgi:hypothetical protein
MRNSVTVSMSTTAARNIVSAAVLTASISNATHIATIAKKTKA